MTPTTDLINFSSRFEGCSLVAYWDNYGHTWTIGFGHTDHVYAGDTCTREQALAWLLSDMAAEGAIIARYMTRAPSQQQYDALCDLAYNVGGDRVGRAGIMQAFNAGEDDVAAEKFAEYGPLTLPGIPKRRAGERAIYLYGDYSGAP